MPYLPRTPRTLREIVLADLMRAQRLKLRVQDEIDPQFRIASPEGDWWIGMTLNADLAMREMQMRFGVTVHALEAVAGVHARE